MGWPRVRASVVQNFFPDTVHSGRGVRGWGRRETRGIRGFPAGMGVNVAGIPRGWIWQLRDSRGDGFFLFSAGTPREWSTNSAVKNFGVHTAFRQTIDVGVFSVNYQFCGKLLSLR